ncbi:MAG: ATP-binding protein [Lachnospiraceae bacterium]|nr:ATP-binding protein [Lachnospiraceae bacterium]
MLITGVRQCGKTYTIRAFGEAFFPEIAYINFEESGDYAAVFDYDFDTERILNELGLLTCGHPIDPAGTLIVFDEIQECPRAITSLKYFCEDEKEYWLICAGSLLGVELKRKNVSFPVGKVDRLQMYPMCFEEFLLASEEKDLHTLISGFDPARPLPEAVSHRLEQQLRLYLLTGGMPYVVRRWFETRDYHVIDKALDTLLQDYRDDFSKHADAIDIPRLSQIWTSVPQQLAKDNQKFVFSHVHEGGRARDLEDSMQWLVDAGLVYKQCRVTVPALPLSGCADDSFFKVYLCDVGLMRRLSRISCEALLLPPSGFSPYRGAITENYVLTELIASGYHPCFWKSKHTAEVDFLVEHHADIIPVEVKSATHTRAKSLALYCKTFKPRLAVKVSMKNIGIADHNGVRMIQLPLYLFWRLPVYCA